MTSHSYAIYLSADQLRGTRMGDDPDSEPLDDLVDLALEIVLPAPPTTDRVSRPTGRAPPDPRAMIESNHVVLLPPTATQNRQHEPCCSARQSRQVRAPRAAYTLAVERRRVAELAELCRVAVERKADGPVGHEPQLAA
jgi:hypothetical protein